MKALTTLALAFLFSVAACADRAPAAPSAAPLTPAPASSAVAEGDHRVTANGHELAYHVRGHGPVCIVHPGGPGFDWTYLRMPEAESKLTLVYLEPVGTGASSRLPTPAGYTLDRYAEELEAFRGALGVERACVIGHSHGGFVAQQYAIAHADHLASLVLYDSTAYVDAGFGPAAGAQARNLFGTRPWFADAMAAMRSEESIKTDDEAPPVLARELPLYFADFDAHGDAYRARFAGMHISVAPSGGMRPFDHRAELAKLNVPTLIFVGRRDFIVPVTNAQELQRTIPGSELVVLEQSGHMGHIEEPAAFSDALARFVSAHPAQPDLERTFPSRSSR